MERDLPGKQLQAAFRESGNHFWKIVGSDLNKTVGNSNENGFSGADHVASNSAKLSLGFGYGQHVHKLVIGVTRNRSTPDSVMQGRSWERRPIVFTGAEPRTNRDENR